VSVRATAQFGASCVFTVGPAIDSDVSLNIASGADTIPTFTMGGGLVTASNAITTGIQKGGTLYKDSAPITTFYLMGGTCHWTDNTVSGDAVTIYVYPGATLDMRNTSQEIVVTNVWEYAGANILRYDSLHTFTNHYNFNDTK